MALVATGMIPDDKTACDSGSAMPWTSAAIIAIRAALDGSARPANECV